MVNTKLDIHICGPINGLPFWPTSIYESLENGIIYGLSMDYLWIIYGLSHGRSIWMENGIIYGIISFIYGIICGLSMDYLWIIYGLSKRMDLF